MKVIITESQYGKAIDSYISYLLEPHEVKTTDNRPNSIYWIKGGEFIVEIQNPEYFWLRYNIWQDISKMFDLDYDETESVINIWLEKHYDLGGLTPMFGLGLANMTLAQLYDFR